MSTPSRARLVARYALFQIPDLALLALGVAAAVRWWDLSVGAAYALIALWIAKDIALFPLLRVAYESKDAREMTGIEGTVGVVIQPLAPAGYVRLGAERWKARLAPNAASLPEGAAIRVVAVRGLTLIVEPASAAEP
ncbi:MAG TPA: NfeD family protein [Myxococcota bacterium]|nr:NfeD family protein [Myxococcota bacterium]